MVIFLGQRFMLLDSMQSKEKDIVLLIKIINTGSCQDHSESISTLTWRTKINQSFQLKLDFYNTCKHISPAEIVLGGISLSDIQTMW